MATGSLGWSPSETWAAAVPEILMAWDAKIEFLRNTNPLGSSAGTAGSPKLPVDETPDQKRQRIMAQMRVRKVRDQAP